MGPRTQDADLGERIARVEQEQSLQRDDAIRRHSEILTAIAASKADLMLHIDERFGSVRRECAIRHEALDTKMESDASAKKSGAQISLQKWQVIAALVGTIFASSTATTLVSHVIGKPISTQVTTVK